MKKRFCWIHIVAFFAALAPLLRAEVSIDPQAGYVYADSGSTLLPPNQLVAWVADVDGDGFGNWSTLDGEGFVADPDDVLLGLGSSGSFQDGTITGTQLWTNVTDPDVVGKPFGLLWFALDYSSDITAPGAGVRFGFFKPGEVVPPDGTSAQGYTWLTQTVGGSLPQDSFHAIYETAAGSGTSNAAPALTALTDQSTAEEQELTFAISASDPDADELTLSVAGLPEGGYFSADPQASPATWTFSWIPAEAESGLYEPVTFTVSDGELSESESIAITVNEVNSPPVLQAIGDRTVTEQQELSFSTSASDADIPANALSFSAANLPAGATFEGNTFSWTPSEDQGGSSYDITFTVADDGTPVGEDSETITVTVNQRVNHPPVAEQPDGLVVQSGETITLPLTASDEDGDDVALSIQSYPSNGDLGIIDQATQTVTYTAFAGFAGEDHFSFQASDGELSSTVIDVYVFVTSAEGWLVTLNLQGADFPALHFGAEPLATDGYEDSYDELLPGQSPPARAVGDNFAALYRPPATDPQSYFLRDIRQLDGDYLWILELEARGDTDLRVSWDETGLPDDVLLGITACNADGTPLLVGDDGVPMTNQSSLTVTQADGILRYCIQPFAGEVEFDLKLAAGAWNLVSLPLTPSKPAVADVFSDINLTTSERSPLRDGRRGVLYSGSVWDWDETSQQYLVADEIEAYQGYWVYVPEGQGGTIHIVGQPAPVPATLHKHWNLIGVGIETRVTNPGIALSSIWKWVNGQYDKTTTLVPGLGQWLYSFQEGVALHNER